MEKIYTIKILGTGGHASMPEKANNPILIAAGLGNVLASAGWTGEQKKTKTETAVKIIGMTAGEKGNIIPDEAVIRCSVTADANHFQKVKEQFVSIVNEYVTQNSAKAEIHIEGLIK